MKQCRYATPETFDDVRHAKEWDPAPEKKKMLGGARRKLHKQQNGGSKRPED